MELHKIEPQNMEPERRLTVVWLAAVVAGLTMLGVVDMARPIWRGGGIDLRSVRSRYVWEDGRKVLLIEGEIANSRRSGAPVSPIRLSVRNRQGLDIYAWTITASKSYLAAGDRASFASRLPAPPEEAIETAVRLEPSSGAAPSAPRRASPAPRAQRLAAAAPFRAAAIDDISNLRKMP